MKTEIKKIIVEQFKGITRAEYEFSNKTEITGRNASGKTTIADAWYWLIADKDYSLKSSPEVHPDFMESSQPSVTAICDIDGKEVTLRKFQKDSRTEKQKEEGAPIRISNQYEVNAVPKSQKDFNAYLEEIGIAIDLFLLLSHPEIFTSQKSADCRKILFGMVSDLTDAEIAKSVDGCEEIGVMLESYTVDEIQAMKKREKKEATENIDAIPNQIIGLEKAKVAVAVDEYTAQKETLKAEIESIEAEISAKSIPSVGELNQRLAILDKEEKQLNAEANAERVEKLTAINAEIGELKSTLTDKKNQMELIKSKLALAMEKKSEKEKRFNALKEEFTKIKAKEYAPTDTKCPYCGQELPVHRLDEAKAHFEEEKQTSLNDINITARDIKNELPGIEAEIKEHHTLMSKLDSDIVSLDKLIADKVAVRAPLEHVIDMSNSDEHERILKEILSVKHQIAERDSLVAWEHDKRNEIRKRQDSIREIDDLLAQEKNNDRINQQIAELQSSQKEYAQAKSDAERILYLLQKISMAKNNMLEEQVNSHFTRVKFRLFRVQKDGKVVDDCTPLVLTKDGEYRDMTYSANTAAITLAQLDIINGLQEFYNKHLPVFIDGSESIDHKNRGLIDMDTQVIMMAVTNDELKVESV